MTNYPKQINKSSRNCFNHVTHDRFFTEYAKINIKPAKYASELHPDCEIICFNKG